MVRVRAIGSINRATAQNLKLKGGNQILARQSKLLLCAFSTYDLYLSNKMVVRCLWPERPRVVKQNPHIDVAVVIDFENPVYDVQVWALVQVIFCIKRLLICHYGRSIIIH